MREILSELVTILEKRQPCVYCAVVDTRGSTPQKAGAVMLVYPDGTQRGTLGGGCIEAEVKQRALRVLHQRDGKAELLTFCLDDNYGWDDGLICGGRMTILADPILDAEHANGHGKYFTHYRRLVEAGQGCTEAVIIGSDQHAGHRYLFDQSGNLVGQLGSGSPTESIKQNLYPLRIRPGPGTRQGVAYLPILPRITLFIVGGGHVGQAVASLAAEVDFDVWVLDDRERYCGRDRFPRAQRLIVGDIGMSLKEISPHLDRSFYCLIVTRGHNHDEEALYHLSRTGAGYVGMIGSKRKIKLIYEDLIARGVEPEVLQRVHAPLGFEIGSQTVPEIAISIVAELIACRNLGSTEPQPRKRIAVETTA